jgi:hypothetical protein
MPSTHSKCVALESPSGRPVVPSKVSNESAPRAATARHSVVETATTRYCELGRGRSKATVFDQCHQLLHPIVNQPGGNHRQNWLLFGDSTVARIVSSTRRCATSNETFRYRCDHCKLLTSTESIRVQNWKKPNATLGEGPVAFGLLNPTCSDCLGCYPEILLKKDKETKNVLEQRIQYFPVEFARDVTAQCPAVGVTTTQEAVQYYLKQNFPQHGYQWNMTTCLVSVGFHDMAIAPDIGITTYVKNVKNYIRQIRPFCKTMLWLGMHQVMGKKNYLQTKAKVLQWNKGVLDMLLQSYPNDVVFIDTTNRTSNASEHQDNIHMSIDYYRSVAMFLFKNLTKFCT